MKNATTTVRTVSEPQDVGSTTTLIDELVAAGQQSRTPRLPGTLLGEVVDDCHPSLLGRARVRWIFNDVSAERWLPCLMGLSIRKGDRVLMLQADNFDEPVVAGVLDGFRDRPRVERAAGAALVLKDDEAIRVTAEDGTALVEVFRGEEGPVARLLATDLEIELPGKLRISADSIELQARRGQVEIEASDDVVLRGEIIRLN